MVSFPYYSHSTPIRIPKDMGIVWEAYHKGVPLLGVPGITLDIGGEPLDSHDLLKGFFTEYFHRTSTLMNHSKVAEWSSKTVFRALVQLTELPGKGVIARNFGRLTSCKTSGPAEILFFSCKIYWVKSWKWKKVVVDDVGRVQVKWLSQLWQTFASWV